MNMLWEQAGRSKAEAIEATKKIVLTSPELQALRRQLESRLRDPSVTPDEQFRQMANEILDTDSTDRDNATDISYFMVLNILGDAAEEEGGGDRRGFRWEDWHDQFKCVEKQRLKTARLKRAQAEIRELKEKEKDSSTGVSSGSAPFALSAGADPSAPFVFNSDPAKSPASAPSSVFVFGSPTSQSRTCSTNRKCIQLTREVLLKIASYSIGDQFFINFYRRVAVQVSELT